MRLGALLPSRRHALAAALTAGLLFVAYPPFSLVAPTFLCLVPLLWMLEESVGTDTRTRGHADAAAEPSGVVEEAPACYLLPALGAGFGVVRVHEPALAAPRHEKGPSFNDVVLV